MAQRGAGQSGLRTGRPSVAASSGDQHAWLAALVESSFDAILSKKLDGTITSWNAAAEQMYGYPAADAIGRSIEIIIPPERLGELRAMDEQLARGERVLPFETVRLTRDGRRIHVQLTMSPILDQRGVVVGASGIGRDITERRRAEERQRRLIEELNHRVRNTLAITQALAAQTLDHSPSAAQFAAAFQGRLAALARTHTVLAATRWDGVKVQDLIRVQLDPYQTTDTGRVTVRGEDTALEPNIALTLGLALHELGSNAARHGALSSRSGRLEITAETVTDGDRRLVLTWCEKGGPPVDQAARAGFGRMIIERSLTYQLDGEVTFELRPAGVRCRIEVPLLEASREPPAGGWFEDRELDHRG
jgi:PAS domain S-box-containing protein